MSDWSLSDKGGVYSLGESLLHHASILLKRILHWNVLTTFFNKITIGFDHSTHDYSNIKIVFKIKKKIF